MGDVIDSVITNNAVINSDENGGATFGIKIAPWPQNKENMIKDNVMYGNYKYDIVSIPANNKKENNINSRIVTSVPTQAPKRGKGAKKNKSKKNKGSKGKGKKGKGGSSDSETNDDEMIFFVELDTNGERNYYSKYSVFL